ncbi:hypothetical protein CANARDRAFT_20970 [[Candida] arabinofermentans NRRL YB-2248]|uniref:Superoxide dismutase 1 copper chaperone n=1 Tax=[Candida] arabinofermentans NRRL YB-2248 TaxID=983967 RepID=A0A1E4T926_9ASCO|nr:hypothetical protein CANARDRAFT_20970 [[Candida] arabinofermentans NRRL YB-2248]
MPSTTKDEFEAVYAVPLHCEGCVDSVKKVLTSLEGISKLDIDLKSQKVTVFGSTAPSKIIDSIQTIGKDAIIRGAGTSNSAAVCILESFDNNDKLMPVKGLARIVSINPDEILVDLTMNGVEKGKYYPSFRESGNIWKGALSTGKSIYDFGSVEAIEKEGNLFKCQEFLKVPMNLNNLIGRSLVISNEKDKVSSESLCGVIARSAGVWENDKYVCSCTGKTIWQERTDAVQKGIK